MTIGWLGKRAVCQPVHRLLLLVSAFGDDETSVTQPGQCGANRMRQPSQSYRERLDRGAIACGDQAAELRQLCPATRRLAGPTRLNVSLGTALTTMIAADLAHCRGLQGLVLDIGVRNDRREANRDQACWSDAEADRRLGRVLTPGWLVGSHRDQFGDTDLD